MWCNTAIGFYYAVVAGWCLRYVIYSLQGVFETYVPGMGEKLWNSFVNDPLQTIACTAIIWIIATIVLLKGTRGIQTMCYLLMPLLLAILIVLAIRAVTLPGAWKGIVYYLAPKPEYLANAETWLQAFAQSLWSTGAGWGIYLTYVSLFTKTSGQVSR